MQEGISETCAGAVAEPPQTLRPGSQRCRSAFARGHLVGVEIGSRGMTSPRGGARSDLRGAAGRLSDATETRRTVCRRLQNPFVWTQREPEWKRVGYIFGGGGHQRL